MKLSDFTQATDSDYLYLLQEIDSLPRLKALIFDDCELPPGCTPPQASVGFCKDSTRYVMYLDGNVTYSGQNRAMRELCSGTPLVFPDFNEMRGFIELLPHEETPYDMNRVISMDELVLPTGTAQPTLDYKTIQQELEKTIIGQKAATETIAHQTALFINKKNPKKPLSIVAYGPPGTGKSEAAKALAKALTKLGPHEYTEVWTDLNQYTEAHSVYRLTGTSPGYIGYNDQPVFEAVVQNPHTVFIFDEMEKSHPDVLKLFLAILDEGRSSARKELDDGSREYDFKHCIFFFTSNHRLGKTVPKKPLGFSLPEDIEDIRNDKGAIEVHYSAADTEDDAVELTKRIYQNTESARRAFVDTGVLREIASRFNCFVEFTELSDEAKIRILAKMVVETGFEYGVRLTHIAPGIMKSLIDASTSEDALTVRSFKSVIEGYLSAAFAQAGTSPEGHPVRLEGSITSPLLTPA